MITPEILAPVGNEKMLRACINAKADAVYLALDKFGARAYAENFTLDNIKEYIDLIHINDMKVYITLNTLIKDSEFEQCVKYAFKLYEFGADAFIIQDLGLFLYLKKYLKDVEFHASTQMAVRDYQGAKILKDLGFDRIVLARETTFEQIKRINTIDVDLEVFVHGSLCVSTSGECYMSAYLGDRSANRGKCAGICRKKYSLYDNLKNPCSNYDYYLSMRDLCAIDHLDKFKDIRIKSLKIEGRMKTPEYVHTVVSSYRKKIKNGNYDKDKLIDVTNRGYTEGFLFNSRKDNVALSSNDRDHRIVGNIVRKNKDKYIKLNSEVQKGDILEIITQKNKKLVYTVTECYKSGDLIKLVQFSDALKNSCVKMLNNSSIVTEKETDKKRIIMEFSAKLNSFAKLKIISDEINISVNSEKKISKSKKVIVDSKYIKTNLLKLNDTFYECEDIKIDIDESIFIKKSELNKMRREALKKLEKEYLKDYDRFIDKTFIDLKKEKTVFSRQISLKTDNLNFKTKKVIYDNVYLEKVFELEEKKNVFLILDSSKSYDKYTLLKILKNNGINGVIINNYSHLDLVNLLIEKGFLIRVGEKLNVFNCHTAAFYSKFSDMIALSTELSHDEINYIAKYFRVEIFKRGRLKLMNTRHCPFSIIENCMMDHCAVCKYNEGYIKSEEGRLFPVKRLNDRSYIYSDKIVNADEDLFDPSVSFIIEKENDHQGRFNGNYLKGVK